MAWLTVFLQLLPTCVKMTEAHTNRQLHHDIRQYWLNKQAFPWWVACSLEKNLLFFLTVPTKVMFQDFNTLANSIAVKKLSEVMFLPELLYKLTSSELFFHERLLVGDHQLAFQYKSDLAVGMSLIYRKPKKL